jgi:hypothetical protein
MDRLPTVEPTDAVALVARFPEDFEDDAAARMLGARR